MIISLSGLYFLKPEFIEGEEGEKVPLNIGSKKWVRAENLRLK